MFSLSVKITRPEQSAEITVLRMEGLGKTIGRQDADVIVADPFCSRLHARVEASVRGVVLVDLDSTNGTFLNGSRVSSMTIRAGDRIEIGDTVIDVIGLAPTDVNEGLGYREIEG